jgi:hypothetical protein
MHIVNLVHSLRKFTSEQGEPSEAICCDEKNEQAEIWLEKSEI